MKEIFLLRERCVLSQYKEHLIKKKENLTFLCTQKKDTDKKKPDISNVKVSGSNSNKSDRNSVPNMFIEGELAKLHKPGGNKQIKPELMDQHLKGTDRKVLTRFPPEPNG